MSAYDVGLDVYFLDPHMARSAIYRAGGADPGRAVKVVETRPDAEANYGGARLVVPTGTFDVRASEVATPAEGDTLTLGATLYTVTAAPRLDEGRRVWTLQTRPS